MMDKPLPGKNEQQEVVFFANAHRVLAKTSRIEEDEERLQCNLRLQVNGCCTGCGTRGLRVGHR